MTFTTEKNKPGSYKITLVEIDYPLSAGVFINEEAGIWKYRWYFSGATVTGSDGLVGYYQNESEEVNKVRSVSVDAEQLTETTSLANLLLQNKSFYYSSAEQTIYVHFDEWGRALDSSIIMGAVNGFCDKAQLNADGKPVDAYYDDIYYRPCIKEIPTITHQKDPLFYGVISFNQGNVIFQNSDGFFDHIDEYNLIGQKGRVLYGFDGMDYDEFRIIYDGVIDKFQINFDKFTLTITDKRKWLEREIPVLRFSQTDYANLSDDSVDIPKPLAWGTVRRGPCVCLNEDESAPASYTFMFLDTTNYSATSISKVYVEGVSVAISSSDMAAGTFVLLDANYDPGNEVTADFVGFTDGGTIENGLDVIVDILNIYGDIAYNTDNYDTTEWASEQATADDIGLWVGDGNELTIRDIIQIICVSLNGIFLVKDNGKYTFRTYDAARTPDRTISNDEWLDMPQIVHDANLFLTSALVKYNRRFSGNTFRRYVDDSSEHDIFSTYGQYRQQDFETVLVTSANAQSLAESIMSQNNEVKPVITRKTKTQNIDLEIMQFVYAEHKRPAALQNERTTYEIIGIQKNITKAEAVLTMRYVSDSLLPENVYYLQGSESTGLTLDMTNAEGGTVPQDWTLYGELLYGNGFYQPAGFYQSPKYYEDDGFFILRFTGTGDAGDITYQYRVSDDGIEWDAWTAGVDAVGVVIVPLTGQQYLQYRFIFHSSLWSDTDSITVTKRG